MPLGSGDIVPLFGTHQTQAGQRVSSGLARRMRQEMEGVAASVEVAAAREIGQAFLTSLAMHNVTMLVNQAETDLKNTPAAAQFYEAFINAYSNGAGYRIGRGL